MNSAIETASEIQRSILSQTADRSDPGVAERDLPLLQRANGKSANRRLAREWKTVTAMIRIYCRDQHGGEQCQECLELTKYVRLRLDRCRFGENKPTCAKCPVHCYRRDRRDQIKAIMRYSGPKMLWEHPWLSLWHFLDGWFGGPKSNPTVGS